jgi:hypothetical protein
MAKASSRYGKGGAQGGAIGGGMAGAANGGAKTASRTASKKVIAVNVRNLPQVSGGGGKVQR